VLRFTESFTKFSSGVPLVRTTTAPLPEAVAPSNPTSRRSCSGDRRDGSDSRWGGASTTDGWSCTETLRASHGATG
jgi:hypothetical protein